MAPEAINAPDAIDARADLYALGAVGYFLLTGQHVFSGRTLIELCSKHLYEVPVAPLCSMRSIFDQSVTPKGNPASCMF